MELGIAQRGRGEQGSGLGVTEGRNDRNLVGRMVEERRWEPSGGLRKGEKLEAKRRGNGYNMFKEKYIIKICKSQLVDQAYCYFFLHICRKRNLRKYQSVNLSRETPM